MSRSFATYESNVLFALRFMIDHEVVGGNWIEFPPGSYSFQGVGDSHKLSHCQLEAHIHCNKVISHKPEGMQWLDLLGLKPGSALWQARVISMIDLCMYSFKAASNTAACVLQTTLTGCAVHL